ncbi:hypothetical protein OTU49_013697, partial [Cherax quadricarinatus]
VRGRKLYNFLMHMKAVYYYNHPEYAAKCPDDDINSSTIEMCGEKPKERCDDKCNIEEVKMNSWDSDGYSPHRLVYDDTHSDSLSSASAELHSQSSSKFDIVNLPLDLSKHGPVVQVSSKVFQ